MMMAQEMNEKIPSRTRTPMATGPTWPRNPVNPPPNWVVGAGDCASRGGIRPRRGLKSKLNLSK
jgi:hypothetical protein